MLKEYFKDKKSIIKHDCEFQNIDHIVRMKVDSSTYIFMESLRGDINKID